jgi:hypothetical protein
MNMTYSFWQPKRLEKEERSVFTDARIKKYSKNFFLSITTKFQVIFNFDTNFILTFLIFDNKKNPIQNMKKIYLFLFISNLRNIVK